MTERDPFDRQREEALELVRIARMCMNPKVNANWFERATKLLNETRIIDPINGDPLPCRCTPGNPCAWHG